MWNTLRRWRTWIVNTVTGAIILPDLIMVLSGFDWGTVIPAKYLPFLTLANLILNVWMRPRAAVLPHEVYRQ